MDTNKTVQLTTDAGDPVAVENLQKIRDLYSSCMNETRLEELGREPLLQHLFDLLQIFPVPGSTIAASLESTRSSLGVPVSDHAPANRTSLNRIALARAMGYFDKLDIANMNPFGLTVSSRDTSKRLLMLFKGGWTLSKDVYQSETIVARYKDTVGRMLHLIVENPSHDESCTPVTGTHAATALVPAKWRGVAEDAVDFELQLLQAPQLLSQRQTGNSPVRRCSSPWRNCWP